MMALSRQVTAFIFFFYMFVIKCDNPSACQICQCINDHTFGEYVVQCSGRNLSTVPVNVPFRATALLLDNNNFTSLQSHSFKGLEKLNRLDISRNFLQTIHGDAFQDLSQLLELNLESNKLTLNVTTFPEDLFKPLLQLRVLKLDNNCDHSYLSTGTWYPDSSFQYLSSLQELYIDGLPTAFGKGFLNLTRLKNLTLSGSKGCCSIPFLKNCLFANVPHLEMLNISNCITTDTEPSVFSALKNIHTLDVSLNRGLGFCNFSKAMCGLQNSSIRILKMNSIYPMYGSYPRLDIKHIVYLKNTPLKELHIDDNGIIGMEQGTLPNLPQTLEVLSARENRFSYNEYILEFISMKSLLYFDISFLNRWRRLPLKRDVISHLKRWPFRLPLPVPPKLETFVISSCSLRGLIHTAIAGENSLKTVIANKNLLTAISGDIYGLEKVEYVDLSHNLISSIDDASFSNYSVIYLDLSYNDLGKCFSEDANGQVFQGLTKLLHLNISANNIYCLTKHIFDAIIEVQTLIVAHNDLNVFDVPLRHMRNLTYLDLAYNKLQYLSSSVRDDIDQLTNVTVRLEGNMLSCTCHDIDFLRWIQKNNLKFNDLNSTMCIFSNDKQVNLTDLDTIVGDLENHCNSHAAILIFSISLFMLVIIIILVITGYRYRWRLRRMYYVGKKRQRLMACDEDVNYLYDAFVSYAETERDFIKNFMIPELEQTAGLKLCVHDRDFIPGTVIASNIANAIQNSRKTLILLSPSFLESEWCQYEYNIARAEGVSRREIVVVGVLYRPVALNDMPRDMALLFAQYSYLEYDIDGHDDEIFWQNIIDAVRTPEPTDG